MPGLGEQDLVHAQWDLMMIPRLIWLPVGPMISTNNQCATLEDRMKRELAGKQTRVGTR